MLKIYDLRKQMRPFYSSLFFINSTVLRRRLFDILIQQLVSELNYLTQTDVDLRRKKHFRV
jgi:hypothetical protein